MNGWFKTHRKIIDWEWYKDGPTFRVFFHLMAIANWEPKKWQGEIIDVGEVITGRKVLADALDLSEQQVRTALNRLEKSQVISRRTTNKYTVIKVLKYRFYQELGIEGQPTDNQQLSENQPTNNQARDYEPQGFDWYEDFENNQQITNNQPTNNQQITTPKEDKTYRHIEEKNDISCCNDARVNISNAIKLYEQNIGVLSPVVVDELRDILQTHASELLELAIAEAAKANARNIKYIRGILRNWDNAGVKTVADAQLAVAEHNRAVAVRNTPAGAKSNKKNTFQDYGSDGYDAETAMTLKELGKGEDYE